MNTTAGAKGQTVADITPGGEVRGIFLIGAASQQQAKNGPFWRLELRDATGAREARIWSPLSQQYADLAAGQLVEVEGRADVFRDQLQIGVNRLRQLSAEERAGITMADFLPSSSRPPADMLADIEALCRKELRHKPWRKLIESVLRDPDIRAQLLVAPAAKNVHHAWTGGLLEHLLGVARLCMLLADAYPRLDRQTLLVGALTHDLGKLWELSGGLANEYTDEGRLVGHTNLALERLEPFIRKSGLEPELALHLRHLILSHHGLPEYGAPREPQTAEAFALHHADNLDAKLTQVHSLFDDAMPPEEAIWSPYQATLKRAIYRAPRTPAPDAKAEKDKAQTRPPQDAQCSLL